MQNGISYYLKGFISEENILHALSKESSTVQRISQCLENPGEPRDGYKSYRQVENIYGIIWSWNMFLYDISMEHILSCKSTSSPSTVNVGNLARSSYNLALSRNTASIFKPTIMVWTQILYSRLPIKSLWLVLTLIFGVFSELRLCVAEAA